MQLGQRRPPGTTAATGHGRWRLEDPDDFVRLEIAAALERNIRVIPVLVEGAQMPRPEDLPDAFVKLARRNALSVRHESFRADADRLLSAIEPILRPASQTAAASGLTRTLKPPAQPESTPPASTVQPTILASASPNTGWSVAPVHRLEHPSKWGWTGRHGVLGVAFSPDGRWLATATGGNRAVLWVLTPPGDQ